MNRIVVLGESDRVRGFRVAGATVIEAEGEVHVVDAWDALPPDTTLAILTTAAAAILGDRLAQRPRLVWTVMP